MANNLQSSDNLDFFNGKKQGNNQQATPKKVEFGKFKQIAIGAIAVLSLTAVGVGGMYAWDSHQKAKVEEVENHIRQIEPTTLFALMNKEKETVQKTYLTNKALFGQYDNYRDILLALEMKNTDTKKIDKNNSLYRENLQALDADKASIEKLIDLTSPGVSFETKKNAFLGGADIAAFNKWESSLKSNSPVYAGALITLHKETKQNLAFLEDTKKEIIQTVNQKIASKDYNLNATESALAAKVSNDLNGQISELEKVKRELNGTDQAHLLTNSDLNEAKEAVSNLQSEAVAQINQDKAQVESLLASAPVPSSNWDDSAISNGNTNTLANTSNQKDDGWGFFEYFLLYNWLSGGSSNRPSAMASFNSSSHYNSIQSNLYNRASSRYDINNNDSYLNRSLSGNYNDHITSNLRSNKNSNRYNTSTPNTLAKGLMPNNSLNKVGTQKVQLGSLDKFRVLKAKKFNISDLKAKIKKIHTKAVTAKKEYKVAVERKEAKRREALAAKSASSSVSGFSKKNSSSYSSSSRRSSSSSRRR